MLPTNNINCCSCLDCCYKVNKPFDDVNRRNRRIDKLKEDPERAAKITRYGWTGVIGAIFAIVLQIIMFFLTNKFLQEGLQKLSGEGGVENIKHDFVAVLSNAVVGPLALVTFVCGIVAGCSGFFTALLYGRYQKRLNDRSIGKASTICGFICLVVMIVGIVLLVVSL